MTTNPPRISLPKAWPAHVASAVVHVISLAQFATAYTRGWAANSVNARIRLKAKLDRANQEIVLRREEIRIKDARMAQIDPHRRPHYPPTERMAILELKAARNWSLQQTADGFFVTAATVASWMKCVDEKGPDALVQLREPVNKFPEFVRYVVQRLKTLCPTMGKVKMAETLARAGLHLGPTTIGRILMETPAPQPVTATPTTRVISSKYPNHVWIVDLTAVPTISGFWCSWLPLALPQCYLFCWWLSIVIDHCSRRAMGFSIFRNEPKSTELRSFLSRTIRTAGTAPRHLISDKGSQFWQCAKYKQWCRRGAIKPRFGAVGKKGSIAMVERLILTTKQVLRHLPFVPLRREPLRLELTAIFDWYNEHRPHTGLGGKTPDEVYHERYPANRRPRFEPRTGWPRGSPCAKPWALLAGKPAPESRSLLMAAQVVGIAGREA